MATELLQQSTQYGNPYEQAKHDLSGYALFDEELWNEKQSMGLLNEYIGVLSEAMKSLNLEKFDNTPEYKYLTGANRYSAIINELYEDRETIKTYTDEYVDEYNQKQVETFTGTPYEYNKHILKQLSLAKQQEILRAKAEEEKEKASVWAKIGGTALDVVVQPMVTSLEFVENLMMLPYRLGSAMWASVLTGENFNKTFKESYQVDSKLNPGLIDELSDSLKDFEAKYSTMRDVDGNYVGVGKYIGGAFDSIAKMAPAMLLNLIPGAGQAASALYWVGLGVDDFKQMADDPRLESVGSLELVANAAVSMTLEWAISRGMAKAFGATTVDKLTHGYAAGEITGKSKVGRVVTRITKDMIQEGTEEVLQELSGWFIDNCSTVFNENFAKIADLNVQTLIDASADSMRYFGFSLHPSVQRWQWQNVPAVIVAAAL